LKFLKLDHFKIDPIMKSNMLPIIRSNAEYDIGKVLPFILQGNLKQKYIDLLCRSYRRRGICSFFLDGTPKDLLQNLQKSGSAYLYYLRLRKDKVQVLSKASAFFDAIACNDFSTANGIAHSMQCVWNKDEEYEDDFLYVCFLLQKFFLDVDSQNYADTMNRFESVLEGGESARFEMCRAFIDKDDKLFSKALKTMAKEHAEHYKEGRKYEYILEEEWATEGQLFIEGLALIHLAERLEMATDKNYALIPSLVRAEVETVYGPETWREQ
jgi:hypothetical protein